MDYMVTHYDCSMGKVHVQHRRRQQCVYDIPTWHLLERNGPSNLGWPTWALWHTLQC